MLRTDGIEIYKYEKKENFFLFFDVNKNFYALRAIFIFEQNTKRKAQHILYLRKILHNN